MTKPTSGNHRLSRPTRTYRASDHLFNAAKEKADSIGKPLSGVIVEFLEAFSGTREIDTTSLRARPVPKPTPTEKP